MPLQANALTPPPEAEEQASKRVKGSDEFSMKYLVEKFYGRVRALGCTHGAHVTLCLISSSRTTKNKVTR